MFHNDFVSLAGNLYGLEKFWAFLKYYKVSVFFSLVVFCIVWVLGIFYYCKQIDNAILFYSNVADFLCVDKLCTDLCSSVITF